MRFYKSNHGLGHNQFQFLLQLEGKEFLIIGEENVNHDSTTREIGESMEFSLSEITEMEKVTLDQIINRIDHKYMALLRHLDKQEKKAAEEKFLNSSFYVQERNDAFTTSQIVKMLAERGLTNHYSTGGALSVRCNGDEALGHIEFFIEKGIPAGYTLTSLRVQTSLHIQKGNNK